MEEISQDQTTRPVVFVVHASVGSGHRSAANAIAQAFKMLRDDTSLGGSDDVVIPNDLDVEVIDILDYGRINFNGDRTASIFTGVTRPIYDLTWRYVLTGKYLWGGGSAWSTIMFPRFVEYTRRKRPIAVICTHITAANVVVGARMTTGLDFPIICVPTDYEVEGLWPHSYTDLFCVANESMAETLRARKVPDQHIRVTGIPTRLAFRTQYDRNVIRDELGLPRDRYVILAMAGAHLPRPYIHFREVIDQLIPLMHTFQNMHLVVLAGTDKSYAYRARQLVKDNQISNVTVFDYIENVAPLMAASDLALCKSGGLTVTECLCAGVPMILMGKAYGQEKANVRMLTATGAALHVTTLRELVSTLRHIETHPESTRALLLNASFLRRPNAAIDIALASYEFATSNLYDDLKFRIKHFLRFFKGYMPAHTR